MIADHTTLTTLASHSLSPNAVHNLYQVLLSDDSCKTASTKDMAVLSEHYTGLGDTRSNLPPISGPISGPKTDQRYQSHAKQY